MRTVFDITIDFKKSKGSYLYDKKTGKRFLDLFSMFSSLPLGYNHAIFDGSFDEKIKHIAHLRMSNNLFSSEEMMDFESKFQEISFHKNLHFCSTGALAVEAALKCAFEYTKNPEAIVLGVKNSFHGRTIAAIYASGSKKMTEGFGPKVAGFDHFDFGN